MSSSSSDLTALSYNVDSIGKLFSDSKTRHTWTMDIGGETHVVVVTASWNSGKFVVELNGYERFHQTVSGVFTYSFKFQDRFFKIVQMGDQLLLTIDTVPFNQFSAKAKVAQAALLKSYESRSRPQVPQVKSSAATSRTESPEPFTGDLAKRLGKKKKTQDPECVEQGDEDDFFSAPVKIQSFVSPQDVSELTVIPNLIEFGEPAPVPRVPLVPIKEVKEELPLAVVGAEAVTPLTGPVTPRDKISPSKLTNPFDAFDELVVTVTAPEEPAEVGVKKLDNPFM